MMPLLRRLASTRLTLLGMAMLAVGAGLSYDNPVDTPVWVLVVPLAFLALNLFAAIIAQPGINRRPGLLMFHVGLLAVCVLVAIGRLSVYEARVELLQGTEFEPSLAFDVRQGPWHGGKLSEVKFVQGPYSVEYGPQLSRGPTRSQVLIPDGHGGWQEKVVGDDTPLVLKGYRFYTTFNKGFASIITWLPEFGMPVSGAVHMPSYPLFEYKQANSWITPAGEEVKLWLRMDTAYDTENDWTLSGNTSSGVLVVNNGGQRVELSPGDEVSLKGGRLRYDSLGTWMGYKIYYDPTLMWLFIGSVLAVVGLMQHYWSKFASQPMRQDSSQKSGARKPSLREMDAKAVKT